MAVAYCPEHGRVERVEGNDGRLVCPRQSPKNPAYGCQQVPQPTREYVPRDRWKGTSRRRQSGLPPDRPRRPPDVEKWRPWR